MEVLVDQFLYLFGLVGYAAAQLCIVERAQLLNDAVDHGRREHTVLLEDTALTLQTVGRRHTEACQQLIEVGRAVGRAHLNSLLDTRVVVGSRLQWVGSATHVDISSPAQGHTHQHRPVAVAPAHVGRSLLMRYKAEIAGGVLVAKGGDGRCQVYHARNHLTGSLAEHTIGEHLVLAVLHHAHVDMQARAGLARGNLRRKGDITYLICLGLGDKDTNYSDRLQEKKYQKFGLSPKSEYLCSTINTIKEKKANRD